MQRIITVTVIGIISEDSRVQWLATDGGSGAAVLYRDLYPGAKAGDRLRVNITAGLLGLGTGGADFVTGIEHAEETAAGDDSGHIMKCRYLPVQHSVLTVESPEYRDGCVVYEKELDLGGKRILLCELHSMLPVVWELYRNVVPEGKLLAVIDDQASLGLPFSRHLSRLHKEEDFISVSIGQAFGGKFEAVNLLTALQFACTNYPEALLVITVGPGVTGTGTRYGFSGIVQSSWANMIGKKGGCPVWTPRLSQADKRKRHVGLSHHTITALTELTYADSVLPLPAGELTDRYLSDHTVSMLRSRDGIHVPEVEETAIIPWVESVLGHSSDITTMKRGIKKDLLFFTGVGTAVHWLFS
ncbi:hypothetical protein CR205_07975 [Alteribacter lacisalsi]|uniref:DUF3866 family protein n=1 Tax=Alteribacter lacisalsi TaxID=2045244 RepID=A0A2W0H9J3_9BACI|nr:DUF3866 family protein [Alteribacter lacisalsi]PYZ98513.1 hypothetical protein CR205_07975 [Alteribacter lacisalsi]